MGASEMLKDLVLWCLGYILGLWPFQLIREAVWLVRDGERDRSEVG